MSEWMWPIGGLLVALVALPVAVWIKRAGERDWRRHQVRQVTIRIVANVAPAVATLTGMATAMASAMRAAADFERTMAQVAKSLTAAETSNEGDA
ncbi:hypothetical protein [Nocardioides soli]|uniref:Uncharacterized protein n=1 Tax=Nocardioides soli TaxID=1036020 RepID=A0A7W4VSM0_9ACTN|nr:hypothetical protein [Nocardioides soli]MBB3041006.1 hypothetical protein [Nocardioides soli]